LVINKYNQAKEISKYSGKPIDKKLENDFNEIMN
jgi:hypothetical protein